MTTTTPGAGVRAGTLTPMHKVGLGLASMLALGDLLVPFVPHPEGEGPPAVVDWSTAALGLITLAGVAWAIRSAGPAARRLVAGSRILSALLAMPVFFVGDVPVAVQVVVATALAVTAASVVLVLTPHPTQEVRS